MTIPLNCRPWAQSDWIKSGILPILGRISSNCMQKKYGLLALSILLMVVNLAAQPGQMSLQTFATGFSNPLFVTNAGDGRIFVVQQAGKIYILNQQGQRTSTPFLDIDPRVNSTSNERGLLGLAFHPDYKNNGYFFVNYSNTSGSTIVSRFSVTADSNIADPNSEVILLTISQPYSNHNGGCINFGPDGYLYIGMGDGGSAGDPGNRAQNGTELLGKMLRIDVDHGLPYTIPVSNPYYGMSSIRNEIWAIGMRNPWRWSFDKVTGDMWIGDVGQGNEEEVDFWAATDTTFPNFGWRCYEGFGAYNTSGCQPQNTYDPPIYSFSHALGSCSITGGYVYRGARFQSMWGTYFFTDYCSGYLWQARPNGTGGWITSRSQSPFVTNNLVSFGQDVYGEMYLTGIGNGNIYHLVDTTCTPMAYIPGGDTIFACQPGGELHAFGGPTLGYQWQLGGADISGANAAVIVPAQAGDYRVIVSNGSCADTSNTVHVELAATPVVTFSLPDTSYCDDAVPVTTMRSPIGGTIFGPGAAGIFFDPSAAGVGSHQLIYVYTDPQTGCSASDTFQVNVNVCIATSNPYVAELSIAPNPGAGLFVLQFQLGLATDYRLEVTDLQGKRLEELEFVSGEGLVIKDLDFRDLANGLYFLRLHVGDAASVLRFVVQH